MEDLPTIQAPQVVLKIHGSHAEGDLRASQRGLAVPWLYARPRKQPCEHVLLQLGAQLAHTGGGCGSIASRFLQHPLKGRTLFLLGRGAGVRAIGRNDDGRVRVLALGGALVDTHAAPGTSNVQVVGAARPG